MTRDEALAILESGEFDAFVGAEEDLEIEFKGEPYQLDSEAGKFELAKDSSALANASGGVIVLGVQTKRHEESPADVAAKIRLLGRELHDETRYLDVIGGRVYPRLEGVRIRYFDSAFDSGRGLVAIDVPPQDDRKKYFLVQRPIVVEGKVPGWLVGIAIRSFGRVDEQRIGELHSLVNSGLNVSRQLSAIEAGVARLDDQRGRDPTTQIESPADRLADVLRRALDELDGMSGPQLYLAAAPTEPAAVPSLARPRGVRELLENPPYSRQSGFNLRTLDRARLIEGTRLRVSNGTRKHIDLLDDGTLLAIATFQDFLGWGRRDFLADPKANGLAVIEFTYDFVLLYEHLVGEHIQPRPHEVRFGIGIRHAIYADGSGGERKMYVAPGPIGGFDFYGNEDAPSYGFDRTTDVEVAEAEPHVPVGEAAYNLVKRFYNWFGHMDDAIPYTTESGTAIDVEQILTVR